jgi:hypothetical protein
MGKMVQFETSVSSRFADLSEARMGKFVSGVIRKSVRVFGKNEEGRQAGEASSGGAKATFRWRMGRESGSNPTGLSRQLDDL